MDQGANYARYNPNILGPAESLQYVQDKVENLENRRAKVIESIKLRKNPSIVKAAEVAYAQLDQDEEKQRNLPIVGKVVLIGAVYVAASELVTGGWALLRWLLSRQRARRLKPGGSTAVQGQRNDSQEKDAHQKVGKRLHTRDWLVE